MLLVIRMKKIVLCIFLSLFSGVAMAETVAVDSSVMSEWGSPKGSHAVSSYTIVSKSQEGWSNGNLLLVYMARKIVAHGGYFCFTTLDTSWYANYGRWTIYRQPIGEKCAWYCETGYAGENCEAGIGTDCNTETISQSDLESSKITTTTGDIEPQLRTDKGLFTYHYMDGGFEGDAILTATAFLANGRGITARPVTFLAGAWDHKQNKVTATAMSAEIKGATSTIQKTLCASGWSGADCATPTETCTACPDNKVFIVSKAACSTGKLDPEHPNDKGYSCNGDRTKWMNSNGECAGKGYTSSAKIASDCWKTLTSYDFKECLHGKTVSASPSPITSVATTAAPVAATAATSIK